MQPENRDRPTDRSATHSTKRADSSSHQHTHSTPLSALPATHPPAAMSMLPLHRAQHFVAQLGGQAAAAQLVQQANANHTDGEGQQTQGRAAEGEQRNALHSSKRVHPENCAFEWAARRSGSRSGGRFSHEVRWVRVCRVATSSGGGKKRGDIAKISLSQEEYDFRIEVRAPCTAIRTHSSGPERTPRDRRSALLLPARLLVLCVCCPGRQSEEMVVH